MVSVQNSTTGVRWFESWSDQNKDYKFGSCCLSTIHVSLRDKHKEWWARYLDKFGLGYGV